MKSVAILTGGGDAPGMNAAIRAVTRTGLDRGWKIFGVRNGYVGLITNNIVPLSSRDVGGIIEQGGTMLRSSRCPEIETEEGRLKALRTLHEHRIDALVVIGGKGSQMAAYALHQKGYPVIGIASTTNNDLYGSDICIGVDTALNIALEAIDRLKVTASSHQRAFIVEVMGHECGYVALMVGIAGAAEAVAIPEIKADPEAIAAELREAYGRGKAHAVVVVSEGAKYNARKLERYFEKHRGRLGFELRVTTLGHVQRGGSPTAFDRLLGTRFGVAATEYLAKGKRGIMVGQLKREIAFTPLSEVAGNSKKLAISLLETLRVLAK